ncbi:MAG: hypothetical protein DWQ04_01580 [Chloroflexi bacterium]|nr:MAG: hypothetical protein DWQ04_01580 [Chloroflexota bacterium]
MSFDALYEAILDGDASEAVAQVNASLAENVCKDVKIMVGTAPITQDFAEQIGADEYADDAARAVHVVKKLLNGA